MEIGGVDRRKARLTSQTSVLNKRGRNNNHEGLESLAGLTVDAVLSKSQELHKPIRKQAPTNTVTLLDIISSDESGSAYRGLAALNGIKNKKKSKKSIKDRLKFRRPAGSSSSWSSSTSHPVPTSDFPPNNRRIQQISNPILIERTSLPRSFSSISASAIPDDDAGYSDLTPPPDENVERESLNVGAAVPAGLKSEAPAESESKEEEEEKRNVIISEPTSDDEEEEEENGSGPLISTSTVEVPTTVSLMALLEESGRRAEEDEDEDEEEEEDEEEDEEGGGEEHECTVCMVKHRGFAFVPCEHTFCRLCSKELWVSRGNCPLCTAYIFEILDIF